MNKINSSNDLEELHEKEAMLPVVISKITIQARDATRASLFVGESFFFGFYRDVIRKCNIVQGTKLTIELFQKMLQLEEKQKIDLYFARILGSRDHASTELKRKAQRKGFNNALIDDVIELYRERGFISDVKFASKYITQKRKSSKWGDIKIRAELLKKGVKSKEIDEAFPLSEEVDVKEIIQELVEKRKARFLREKDVLKRRKKIFDHLVRKGFQPGVILQYLDNLMQLIDQ